VKSISIFAILLGLVLISGTFSAQSYADVISPRLQMQLKFTAEQVICSETLVKVIKNSTGNASCVKPKTAEKLAENGWAKQLSDQVIDEMEEKSQQNESPVGTINKIAVAKQTTKPIKSGISMSIFGYAYVFEACAQSDDIRTPEIIVTSDSETKSVKLGSMIKSDSCYTSSVIIKAADPVSISATMLNAGGISKKIESLETQIADLKVKITAAKQKIPKSEDQTPNPENLSSITTMKKDLKNLQDQLRRYLMMLYVPPNVKAANLDIPKSITGKPLEGMSVNLISVTEGVVKPESDNPDLKRFNVVFEACAGKDSVRLPIIKVVSDTASTSVKLIDRIIPNSCQVGVTKINAVDSESIVPKISTYSGVSDVITELEKKIDEIQTKLADQRSSLNLLTSKKLDPSGEEIAAQMAINISELRADLLETRAKLYGVMLLV